MVKFIRFKLYDFSYTMFVCKILVRQTIKSVSFSVYLYLKDEAIRKKIVRHFVMILINYQLSNGYFHSIEIIRYIIVRF